MTSGKLGHSCIRLSSDGSPAYLRPTASSPAVCGGESDTATEICDLFQLKNIYAGQSIRMHFRIAHPLLCAEERLRAHSRMWPQPLPPLRLWSCLLLV